MNTRFSCTGCGACCRDHHIPLTLDEAVRWARDGGQLIVLTEGFLDNGVGAPAGNQRDHAQKRSWPVNSGTALAHVAITFAAYNNGACRNLDANNRCKIYARRPLVCQIYPLEINPHIPLNITAKDCPTQAWEEGPELIVGSRLVDPVLAELIERSRQADRKQIAVKAAICARLGIDTAALKGDGFTVFLPDRAAFLKAAREVVRHKHPVFADWNFQVSGETVAEELRAAGAAVNLAVETDKMFIPLRAA